LKILGKEKINETISNVKYKIIKVKRLNFDLFENAIKKHWEKSISDR